MDKYADYAAYKRYLMTLNLSYKEFEQKLREWCTKHKF